MHVIVGTAGALTVLVALFSIIELVDDLSDVGRGDYTLLRALEHSALRIPTKIFELLPISALIGSIMGLGLLTSTSELTAMRTSGVSTTSIMTAVLKGGVALVAIALLLGELVVPTTERMAYERRSVAISKDLALETNYGLWIRDGLSFINIRQVLPNAELADLYIYEFDSEYKMRIATHAKRARFEDDSWVLEEIAQSELGPDGVVSRKIDQAVWHSLLGPDQVAAVPIRPEGLSVVGLVRYLRYLQANGLNSTRYSFALWNKFVYPLAAAVMVFVSVVLILGPLRDVSLGLRVLTGIVVGVVFYIIQQTAMQMGVIYEAAPFLTVVGPPLVFFVIGLVLTRRLH